MRYYVEFHSSISRLGIVPNKFGSALGGKTSHQLTQIAIFHESDNRGGGKIMFHLDISISRCDIGSSPPPPRGGLQLVLHSYASYRRRRKPRHTKKNAVRIRTASTSWRRRESNPRPNKEPQGFLHVYSALDPLARDGRRRPDPLPQSLKSHTATETHAALSLN